MIEEIDDEYEDDQRRMDRYLNILLGFLIAVVLVVIMGLNRYLDVVIEENSSRICPACGAEPEFGKPFRVRYHSRCPQRPTQHLHYACPRCWYSWPADMAKS